VHGPAPDRTGGARLAVAVITRDRRDRLLATLDRLAALGRPVTVVDNGSRDGTVAAVRSRHPAMRVTALGANLGGAARAIGARAAGTPYVAFADDDSWWAPGALELAEAMLDAHPRLALVAGRVLVGPDARLDPTCELMARSPLPATEGLPGRPVLGFLACAAVVRAEAFLAAGGFHPRLGIGGEETLLAVDLARAGWWLAYVPELVAHHEPPPRADHAPRRRREVRNALWTAWLRRRGGGALRRTAAVLANAGAPARWTGLAEAVCGLGWVLRERRPVGHELEARLRLIER
jgi:N-acetylglucosaminyl-diphospho-decaprenol L-rhamnosyltransferase